MPFTAVLKQLLPGLLPLFIFIAADEIWGTTTGLYVAVVSGLFELMITRIRYKKWDGFIVIDTAFLVVMGGVSILLDNAIFFKLKPALLELIMCIILGAAAASPKKFFTIMTSRYLKNPGISLNEKGISAMKRMMLFMTFLFTAHTALIIYSAFRMSQAAWAFISGGLFYIIFGVIIAGQFVVMIARKRRKS